MTDQIYTRVEFTADIGFDPFVTAFVDFSSQGISFGAPPYNVQIKEGAPEDESNELALSEYQRVTVHADGKVVTHLPTPVPLPDLKGMDQSKTPLAQWGNPWCMRFEFIWSPDHIGFVQPWLAKPKTSVHQTCLNLPVEFSPEAVSTVVYVCVVTPGTDVNELSLMVPGGGQLWVLTGGWPWVVVQMSNVKCPKVDNVSNAGRDYRKSAQP